MTKSVALVLTLLTAISPVYAKPAAVSASSPFPKLSAKEKSSIQTALKSGRFSERWKEGTYWSEQIQETVFHLSDRNQEKEFDSYGFDPFGITYALSVDTLPQGQDLKNADPVSVLTSEVRDLISTIRPLGPEIYTQEDRAIISDVAKVLVGISYEADIAKGLAIGQRLQLDDLQTFIFDKVIPYGAWPVSDANFALIAFEYAKARHFFFRSSDTYELASSLQQTGYVFPKDSASQTALLVAAANYFALGAISKTPDRPKFGFPENFALYACLTNGLNLAEELNLFRIQRKLLPLAIKSAQNDDTSWQRTSELENRLLSISDNRPSHWTLLDRISVTVRKVQLTWSGWIFYIVSMVLIVLLIKRSWSFGLESVPSTLKSKFMKTLFRGFVLLSQKFLSREKVNFSALDRIIFALIAFGIGIFPSLISKRADFILNALLGR